MKYLPAYAGSLRFGHLSSLFRAPANAGCTNKAWGTPPKAQAPGISAIQLEPTTWAIDVVFAYDLNRLITPHRSPVSRALKVATAYPGFAPLVLAPRALFVQRALHALGNVQTSAPVPQPLNINHRSRLPAPRALAKA